MNLNTTEKLPAGFKSEPGMTVKASLLRWKLGNKAKQEPRFDYHSNRSQRRSKPFRKGETVYAGLKRYGFKYL